MEFGMQTKKKIARIVYCLLICVVVVVFRIRAIQHVIPAQFNDTTGYVQEAHAPILSTDFLLGPRGFTIPLFFKIVGVQVNRIVWLQAIFGLFCWGALAFAFLKSLSNYWIGLIAFSLTMVFGLGREVLVWDSAILSESITLSLFALTLAFAFLLMTKWTKVRLAGLFIAATLWIFTRDSNALVLGMAAIGILLLTFSKEYRKRSLIVGVPLLTLSVYALIITALVGRTNQAVTHNYEQRVLTDPTREAYFINKGMPISPAVQNQAGGWGMTLLNSNNPDITTFRDWMLKNGNYVYLQFLISHPKVLFGEPIANRNELITGGEYLIVLPQGFNPPPVWQQLTDITYPKDLTLFIFWVISVVGLAIIVTPWKAELKKWAFPVLLLVICIPAAIVTWNIELMEVERHALLIGVQFHLALWELLLISADLIAQKTLPINELP
jgi:hypothetical protein